MNYLLAVLSLLLLVALIVSRRANGRLQRSLTSIRDDTTAVIGRFKASTDELSRHITRLENHLKRVQEQLVEEVRTADSRVKAARKDAVKRAQAVAHGFESENFAPLIQEQWDHRDFRHMGDPVDFIVFDGMDTVRHSKAGTPLEEVVLLDIKTGKSQLSTLQRRIRDAVVAGRVRFAVYNTDTQVLRAWPPIPDEEDQQLKLFEENK